ncbi:MAG: mannose-1-phosphate guanylyltransferase/mannose-6-phosphate isomerase [Candidatus Paracaedibacteraceae bacterium]|nr:mannose-1-phosphate guanylyltransferase/mannose-6-phosphate isomerase [Candidatus Paracaedibacteraceae bacterium]
MKHVKAWLLLALVISRGSTLGYSLDEGNLSSAEIDITSASTNPLVPTILCGGSGSRLWPASREQSPKFFMSLPGNENFLQTAFLRGAGLNNVSDILTVSGADYMFRVESDCEKIHDKAHTIKKHYIHEPCARNTAAAIATACLYAKQNISPDALLLVLAADHIIENQEAFSNAVHAATELAKNDKIVTFGITPSRPETGYGYIEADGINVLNFVEKPDYETAESYIKSGKFIWNSGMFCFKVTKMLDEMGRYCPDILRNSTIAFENARKSPFHVYPERADFDAIRSDSIDYAVMQKTKDANVIPCDIGWNDIGCWKSLGSLGKADESGNKIVGDAILENCTDCFVQVEKDFIVGVVGLTNIAVIVTPDAMLVVDKNSAQDVKKIYAKLKNNNHDAYKIHKAVHRPWGTYEILNERDGFKVKRIEVKSGAKLSLQSHEHRSEHWVVVQGTAKVLNGDKELELTVNGSTFIPAKSLHRLENIGDELLILIETQIGSYLGEDDIKRYDDAYGRV